MNQCTEPQKYQKAFNLVKLSLQKEVVAFAAKKQLHQMASSRRNYRQALPFVSTKSCYNASADFHVNLRLVDTRREKLKLKKIYILKRNWNA